MMIGKSAGLLFIRGKRLIAIRKCRAHQPPVYETFSIIEQLKYKPISICGLPNDESALGGRIDNQSERALPTRAF